MKRKKKTKKKPAFQAPLSHEQEALIVSLLKEIPDSNPIDLVAKIPDSRCAQHFIEHIPLNDASIIPLLLALRDGFEDKIVGKAIKRALFKLSRKGISTETFYQEDEVPSTILKPPRKDPPLCYVGPVDGTGFRSVMVILHHGGKGLDIGFGVVSDNEGILEFLYQKISRKDTKELKDRFSEESGPFVETSLAHVAAILEDAYQKHEALKSNAPAGYLELRPWLVENTSQLERPVIYDLLSVTETSENVLSDSQIRELFNHELMASWMIEYKALRPFMEDMLNVQNSPIVLNDAQKSARVKEIKEKCTDEIFSPERRKQLRRRLEEMGYIFFKLGQEEIARVALAAAHSVVQEASILKANPVVEALLEWSLTFYMKGLEEQGVDLGRKKSESSPIILP